MISPPRQHSSCSPKIISVSAAIANLPHRARMPWILGQSGDSWLWTYRKSRLLRHRLTVFLVQCAENEHCFWLVVWTAVIGTVLLAGVLKKHGHPMASILHVTKSCMLCGGTEEEKTQLLLRLQSFRLESASSREAYMQLPPLSGDMQWRAAMIIKQATTGTRWLSNFGRWFASILWIGVDSGPCSLKWRTLW